MSSPKNDDIFPRYHKGRVRTNSIKRVSFNENGFDNYKLEELSLQSGDQFDLESLKKLLESEKYDLEKTRRHKVSTLSNTKLQSPRHLCSTPRKKSELDFPPFFERGTPEGQEDTKYSSYSSLTECGKETRNVLDDRRVNVAKVHLLRKFLRSVQLKTPRRPVPAETKNRDYILYIKNVNYNDLPDQTSVASLIENELKKNLSNETVSPTLNSSLIKLVNFNTIYKVYKVLTVDGIPVLAVITSEALYFIQHSDETHEFVIIYSCNFKDLVAAVVGPFSQLVIVLSKQADKFFVNTGLSDTVARELITHLELALRRWCAAQKTEFVFNIAEIADLKQMSVFHDLLHENTFSKNEILFAQYSVWLQEDYVETMNPLLGPQREGYLMAKISSGNSWLPVYVCLKGAVFYIFKKITERVPQLVIPLKADSYEGCRIHNNAERPHTFEIMLQGNSSFTFGAADETEMIEWIRDLHSSAMQVPTVVCSEEKESLVVNCFITLTSCRILVHRFPNEVMSSVLLSDVINFRKSNWPGCYYCLLELSCREASEMGGDWILYFVSESSYRHFCTSLTDVTNFECLEEDKRFLSHQSDRTCARIQSSWDMFFV